MKIRDIMSGDAYCVSPDDTLQEAAAKMNDLDVGLLPVCSGDRVIGILTDRDITIRAVAKGLEPRSAQVREVMSRSVIYCYEDEDIDDATRLMQTQQVRRILVLDRSNRLCGILSLGDLAAEGGDPFRIGEVLHDICEPTILAGY